jgi:hypothetical protein
LTLPAGAATDLLARLGIDEIDRAAMLAARPTPDGTPYQWWRLEHAHRQLATRTGTLDERVTWPDRPTPYLYPWALVSVLPQLLDYHREHGVPDEVSWATCADLGRQLALGRRVRARPGLVSPGWLTAHFRGLLYHVGRLQYLRIGDLSTLWPDGPAEPALDLHIPATGPLAPQACEDSLARAEKLFASCFPEIRPRYAYCHSWLLDPQLAEYLPAKSNIVAFQRRFHLLPTRPGVPDDDLTVLQFVFERDRTPLQPGELDALPQQTALQRAIVTHLKYGRHWHFRPGWFAW